VVDLDQMLSPAPELLDLREKAASEVEDRQQRQEEEVRLAFVLVDQAEVRLVKEGVPLLDPMLKVDAAELDQREAELEEAWQLLQQLERMEVEVRLWVVGVTFQAVVNVQLETGEEFDRVDRTEEPYPAVTSGRLTWETVT
jgi:hypothetical protein